MLKLVEIPKCSSARHGRREPSRYLSHEQLELSGSHIDNLIVRDRVSWASKPEPASYSEISGRPTLRSSERVNDVFCDSLRRDAELQDFQ